MGPTGLCFKPCDVGLGFQPHAASHGLSPRCRCPALRACLDAAIAAGRLDTHDRTTPALAPKPRIDAPIVNTAFALLYFVFLACCATGSTVSGPAPARWRFVVPGACPTNTLPPQTPTPAVPAVSIVGAPCRLFLGAPCRLFLCRLPAIYNRSLSAISRPPSAGYLETAACRLLLGCHLCAILMHRRVAAEASEMRQSLPAPQLAPTSSGGAPMRPKLHAHTAPLHIHTRRPLRRRWMTRPQPSGNTKQPPLISSDDDLHL